jgi:hypothetical protein
VEIVVIGVCHPASSASLAGRDQQNCGACVRPSVEVLF